MMRSSPSRAALVLAAVYDALNIVDTSIKVGDRELVLESGIYCDSSFDTCASGGLIAGGAIGQRVTTGRLGVVVEASSGGQFTSHRESILYDDAFAHRPSRGSFLVRRGSKHPNDGTRDLLVGVTVMVGDSLGLGRVKEGFAPFAGRRELHARPITVGLTAGADFVRPIKNRRTLVLPVRVIVNASATDALAPGRIDVQAGVGLRFGLNQRFT
jgi:hypothetical protein